MTAQTAAAGTHIATFTGSRRGLLATVRELAVQGVPFKVITEDLRLFGTSTVILEITVPTGMALTIG